MSSSKTKDVTLYTTAEILVKLGYDPEDKVRREWLRRLRGITRMRYVHGVKREQKFVAKLVEGRHWRRPARQEVLYTQNGFIKIAKLDRERKEKYEYPE